MIAIDIYWKLVPLRKIDMMRAITVTYPESLAYSLKLADKEFEKEMKTISIIKLYELGKISSGTASKILGISRVDFLEQIGKYQVSVFNFKNEEELNEDIANA
jgi:predicted HTH domain antitoxin